MSNYVKTVNFAAKDALAHLNPSKVAKGTELDTELNNIATAVATKEETSNKNAANGYAGLDASSKLLKTTQYANTAYLDSTNAFTLATTFAGTSTFNAGVTINSTLAVTGAVSLTTVLGISSGGTGAGAATGSGNVVLQTSPSLVTPALGTPVSGNLANCSFPTLNQSTSGNAATATTASSCSGNSATATSATSATSAAGLSATLVIGSGGTNATTAQGALNNLIGTTSGNFVRGNGTNAAVQLMTYSNGADASGGSDGDVWFRYN